MKLITKDVDKAVKEEIIEPAENKDFITASQNACQIQESIYNQIPESKRGSYGVVHTIRILSRCIAKHLTDKEENLLNIGTGVYSQSSNSAGRGIALGILAEYGKEDFANTSPFFISAALSDNWHLREYGQMFFRKLINAHPDKAKELLLETVKTNNPRLRRFVSETLRPVQENKWMKDKPEYPLSIIKHLFTESEDYPRKSVANNLSDLSKQNPELIINILKDLINTMDPNAFKIAYRASRNLIKEAPIKIMDILGIDEYKYKDNTYKRSEYKRNAS